ncbi:MAG: nucleoside triphosphate pyrophosphohydrolase, partial [Clostridia bacterium]|nr:nucleoside triphosphate pyrophosphohydrolase [Clostridia bacterium]
KEAGRFDFDDVADGICKKLIVRHPHVFGDVKVNNSDDVLVNWDEIKKQTKSQKTQTDAIKSVSPALPALMRSAKVQKKAAKVGFDWDNVQGAIEKLEEEIAELKKAVASGDVQNQAEELGDVLFSAVNVSRFLDVEPEEALTRSTEKFISRFEVVEKLACERGIDMKESTLEELDALWDEAKKML